MKRQMMPLIALLIAPLTLGQPPATVGEKATSDYEIAVQNATDAHEVADRVAKKKYCQSMLDAETKLVVGLRVDLRAAMQSGDLPGANAIDRQIQASADRSLRLKSTLEQFEMDPLTRGASVVFLVDCGAAMIGGMDAAKVELTEAITGLTSGQSFQIVVFHDSFPAGNAVQFFSGSKVVPANPSNKAAAVKFVGGLGATGITDPTPAFTAAVALNPDIIVYFEGDFSHFKASLVEPELKKATRNDFALNAVYFGSKKSDWSTEIERIVKAFNGKYILADELSGLTNQ